MEDLEKMRLSELIDLAIKQNGAHQQFNAIACAHAHDADLKEFTEILIRVWKCGAPTLRLD